MAAADFDESKVNRDVTAVRVCPLGYTACRGLDHRAPNAISSGGRLSEVYQKIEQKQKLGKRHDASSKTKTAAHLHFT